jgi:hypothetical protein
MAGTLEFFRFYLMAGVYILAAVLAVSAVVALIEKVFGVDPTPKHVLKQRALQGSRADHDPVATRSNFPPIR